MITPEGRIVKRKTVGKYLRPATSHRQQNGLKPESGERRESRRTAFGHWCSVGRVSYTRWPWKRTENYVSATDGAIARGAGGAHSREIWRGAGDCAGAAAKN